MSVAERGTHAPALRGVEGEPAILVVIGDAVVEHERGLVGGLDAPALDRGERRRVGHVGVQHAGRLRRAGMDRVVDVERGFLRLRVAFDEEEIGDGVSLLK